MMNWIINIINNVAQSCVFTKQAVQLLQHAVVLLNQ